MCRWGSGWLRIAGLFVGVALAAALPAVAAVGGVTPLPGSTTGASTGSAWANLPAGAQTTISSALLTEGVDLVEQAKLTASDGSSNESFGQSVAIDGDTIVVGVPYDAVGANGYQGSVYVFTRPAGGWSTGTQVAKLTASDGGSWEYFAESVAIDGDTVVVGSPGDTISGNFSQGSAYIFTRPASGWASGTEAAKLTAADGTSSARFGQAVAIDGDTIVVGAPGDSIGGSYSQGAAYTFSRPAEGWASGTEAAKLTASTRSSNDYFAQSVAIDGDVIVVGSPGHTAGTNWSQGSAYVFTRPAGGWSSGTEAATLTASDGSTFDQLAGAVAIDGDTIAAGATADSIGPNWYQGSVYVFTKPDGGWSSATELAKLTASDGTSGDALGGRLVIDGDTIAAGARDSDVGTNDSQGSVYVFTRPTGGWSSGVEAAMVRWPSGKPRWVQSVCPVGPIIATSLIGMALNAAWRIASRRSGSHALTPRAAKPSSASITMVSRALASASARRAAVATSACPCRSINPPSQKSNAIKGVPASSTPTMIATRFRRVKARKTNPILVPASQPPSWYRPVSHGAVKAALSTMRPASNKRAIWGQAHHHG